MLVQNTGVVFRWDLTASPSFATYVETYFDLQVQAPDGTVNYYEGGTWATTFTQPSDSVDGLIEIDSASDVVGFNLDQTGVYTLILGTGGASSFTIIDTVLALVVEQDALVTNTVTLA